MDCHGVCVRASSFATTVVCRFAAQIRTGDVVRGPDATFAESVIHQETVGISSSL